MLTSTQTTWLVVSLAFSLMFNELSYRQLNLPFGAGVLRLTTGPDQPDNRCIFSIRTWSAATSERVAALQFSLIADKYRIADDAAWASLIPSDGRIRSPSARAAPDQKYFTIGLYSDLHCLNLLRSAYLAHKDKHESGMRVPEDALAPQCVSQLRQALTCAADLTLDPTTSICEPDGTCDPAAAGHLVVHKCRDWVQVREFVEMNQARTEDRKNFRGPIQATAT
ncbi:unnamed protein product [Mycena citricolor]|uniref:Uncharacterized protein n=1 Tax=Mycena citricolor TaxID=2018698 RepID=A0AAD2K3L5_9AGAR|nr:unnamed protein product [Mycena citricolor]